MLAANDWLGECWWGVVSEGVLPPFVLCLSLSLFYTNTHTHTPMFSFQAFKMKKTVLKRGLHSEKREMSCKPKRT